MSVVSVLWHGVTPDTLDRSFASEWNPTLSQFRQQIRFLVDRYTPISVREFCEVTENPSRLERYTRPPILLTFDDGFKSVVDTALPVLKEFGIPALFFVIGEVIRNSEFIPWYVETVHMLRRTSKSRVFYENDSFDLTAPAGCRRLHALFSASIERCRNDADRNNSLADFAELLDVRRPTVRELDADLRFVGPDDLTRLGSSSLLTVGSHAMTHRFLGSLSYKEQLFELEQSHLLLSRCCASYFPALAYPGGSFNAETISIARQIYRCAFAASWSSRRDMYRYPRVGVSRDTPQILAYAISRYRLTYIIPIKRFLTTVRLHNLAAKVKEALAKS